MFQSVMDTIDLAVATFVIDIFTGLSNDIKPTLRLMIIVSIMFYGLSMIMGWIEGNIKDAVKHVFMALIVYIFATNQGLFLTLTYETFTNAPNMLMGKVLIYTGSSLSGGANQFIGSAYDTGIEAGASLMFGTGWSIGLKFMGLLVMISTLAMCGYASFLIVMSKIAVAILLALSPVFISLLMFKSSRGLFEGWLRQVINFSIIPLLAYTVLVFCLAMMGPPSQLVTKATEDGVLTLSIVMPYTFSAFISFLLLQQVMGIASGIAGGVSLSTMNVVGNRFSSHGSNLFKGVGSNIKLPKFGKNSIKN